MGDSKSVRNNGVDFSPNKLQVLPTLMNFTPNIFQIVCKFFQNVWNLILRCVINTCLQFRI